MLTMRPLILVMFASACWSQQTEFEVASVKPNTSMSTSSNFNRTAGGGLNAINVTLQEMVLFAYDLREHQLIGGTGWLNNDRFDVVAKPGHDDVVETRNFEEAFGKIRLKLRALLADRFKLTVHTETRELPIYALVVGKNGAHLSPAKDVGLDIKNQTGHLLCKGISMKNFADRMLAYRMKRTVVDKTGLAGEFDFEVKYLDDRGAASTDASGPDFLTAMQEQLGLKLESQKGPVEVLVIDRAEKPSAN
jgi:uncharacterized protein (TIGR03435 family)